MTDKNAWDEWKQRIYRDDKFIELPLYIVKFCSKSIIDEEFEKKYGKEIKDEK